MGKCDRQCVTDLGLQEDALRGLWISVLTKTKG